MFTGKITGKFAAMAAFVISLAGWNLSIHASVITTSPALIDGWTISWPTTLQLSVSQDASNPLQIDLQATTKFTAVGQGLQFTDASAPGSTPTADLFVITNDSVTDNTGKSIGDLSFILVNTGAADAVFTRIFSAPSGVGYAYSPGVLANANTEVDYSGTQNNGTTSRWGNGNATSTGNNLTISAPTNSTFAIKQLSLPTDNVINVPEPAILGLLALGSLAGIRRSQRSIRYRHFSVSPR